MKIISNSKKYDSVVIYLLTVILAFLVALISLAPIKVLEMGQDVFFVFYVLPLPYWFATALIAATGFLILQNIEERRYQLLLVFTSVAMIVSFRLAFPAIFSSIPSYEPDVLSYMNTVNSWVTSGINFKTMGFYEHDYPLSFLIAFVFIKLGVPIDLFYRIAPFVIYGLQTIIIYLLVKEVVPNNSKYGAVAAYLFSFSSLAYWVTLHYCPDLVGSLLFVLTLYFSIKFAKSGEWTLKSLAPVLISIGCLILSHHLSTLYLIFTLFGLSLSTWFFKSVQIRGKALSFFILGIFAYTAWFAYGTLEYPNFFNVYAYFSGGYGSTSGLVQQAGILNNLTFVIYPAFIIGLFAMTFLKQAGVTRPRDLTKLRSKIREMRVKQSSNLPFVYSIGFVTVVFLFFVGFGAAVVFPVRVLEVLLIGMYPIASETLLALTCDWQPKWKIVLLFIVILLVVLTGIYRYDSSIQRRVIVN